MNFIIENLNQWGGNFLSFAWPMLWQSSLLVAALFAFDLLFQRKLRGSIRYALWLVALVKLCVPPTLALPTSPAWWLHQTPPPVMAKPLPHYTVTYADAPIPEMPMATLPAFVPPAPAMTKASWLLVVSVAVSFVLLGWLLVRWWQITRQVRRAANSERLTELADAAQESLGMKFNVQVKLTTNSMSPAVCGLFRPAILISQSLAENFSDEQLRAVLLHELIHLRRRDVWVNFFQALLQIFYWWHPLVWLANARIRRVREEAVDDAVMLALRDEAESYAPTLLEVAKLALNRPLVSLGLVGIMESRHALRQRIERLVDFRAPRHAGPTLVSLLGILAFTAVAVPMGEKPATVEKETAPIVGIVSAEPAQANTNAPQVFIQAEFYRIPHFADFQRVVSAAGSGDPKPNEIENFKRVVQGLKAAGFEPFARPRLVPNNGTHAQFYLGNETNWVELDCQPFVTNGLIDLVRKAQIVWSSGGGLVTNEINDRVSVENHGGNVICLTQDAATGSNVVAMTFSVAIITNAVSEILTNSNFRTVLRALEQRGTFESLGEPEAVPSPGRHAQIRVQNLVENVVAQTAQPLGVASKTNLPIVLITADFYSVRTAEVGKLMAGMYSAHVTPGKSLVGIFSADDFTVLQEKIKSLDLKPFVRPRIKTAHGTSAQFFNGYAVGSDRNGVEFDCLPLITNQVVDLAFTANVLGDFAKGGTNLIGRAEHTASGRLTTANHGGIIICADDPNSSVKTKFVVVVGVQILTNGAAPHFQERLNTIIRRADDTNSIAVGNGTNLFFTRTFKVNPITFSNNVSEFDGVNVATEVRSLFRALGINLDSPVGKSVFYNETNGALYVRATTEDLDTIDTALAILCQMPSGGKPSPPDWDLIQRTTLKFRPNLPQIHIKARFIEVPKGTMNGFQNFPRLTNTVNGGFTGILSDTNARAVLRALKSQKGVEVFGEPELVTTSGRQAQMRATQVVKIFTNLTILSFKENGTNWSISSQAQEVETGPILDVVPYVMADGYTINLAVIPSLTEFLGYEKNTNAVTASNHDGEKLRLPKLPMGIPRFTVRQIVTTVNLWDNQTAIIGGMPETTHVNGSAFMDKPKTSDKELLVFITATMVDAAGNRVHGDDDLPFAQKGIPPQPSLSK
jgi:beta-lactamase regulating signal transducer with metallopeptidase domain/Flp pilus assembly secretin CpaC